MNKNEKNDEQADEANDDEQSNENETIWILHPRGYFVVVDFFSVAFLLQICFFFT